MSDNRPLRDLQLLFPDIGPIPTRAQALSSLEDDLSYAWDQLTLHFNSAPIRRILDAETEGTHSLRHEIIVEPYVPKTPDERAQERRLLLDIYNAFYWYQSGKFRSRSKAGETPARIFRDFPKRTPPFLVDSEMAKLGDKYGHVRFKPRKNAS